eukprot:4664533-Pleurochrysis_carterae.AAC.1
MDYCEGLLMSCGDNPEANMAPKGSTGSPKAGQRESTALNLSKLLRELSLLLHAAAIGRDYDANRMIAIATTIHREMAQERGWSSAPAATTTAFLPASVMLATGVATSAPATAAKSVATNLLIPAAASAAVTSSPMSQATPPGDNRSTWPPGPIHVPTPPTPVLDELKRALRATREEVRGGGE